MNKHRTDRVSLPIAKLTAALGLAITLTFTACEEKQAAKPPTEPAAAPAAQQPTQEAAVSESQPSEEEKCPKDEPPITIEAVFLENGDDDPEHEGPVHSYYRLPNGEEISLNGYAPDDVKEGDKVSVTYQKIYYYDNFGDGYRCHEIDAIKSMKKKGLTE
jgi:hypothetical protein